MGKIDQIKDLAKELKLEYLAINIEKIIEEAAKTDISYQELILSLLEKVRENYLPKFLQKHLPVTAN